MATVREILSVKGSQVHTVSPSRTALEAITLMNDQRIGALVVTEEGRLVGMFTERDVLRRVVAHERPPSQVAVAEVMTPDVMCASPDMPVEEASRIMKDYRIRHLPVCDEAGRLLGMVSIGDINAYHANAQEEQIHYLREYVYSGL
jgi:CBS domain-containing protein